MTCILMLLAAMVSEDPFVVTDYAYPAFVITERPDAARAHAEPPKAEQVKTQTAFSYILEMYTASWCGPCQDWKRGEKKRVEESGLLSDKVREIDIDRVRGTGVSRVPEFRLIRSDGVRVGTWIGYVSVASLRAKMSQPKLVEKPVSKPSRSPGLYGRVGTSHESRETLIDHMMEDGIHSGRHSRSELSKLSDEELNDLHTKEHEDAGHVVDSRGLWKS